MKKYIFLAIFSLGITHPIHADFATQAQSIIDIDERELIVEVLEVLPEKEQEEALDTLLQLFEGEPSYFTRETITRTLLKISPEDRVAAG